MRFALVLLVACADPVNPADVARDPAAEGPWRVGVTTIETVDPIDGQTLTIEVWYPATTADDAEFETTLGIPSLAVRDAAIDPRGGPFPLIAFSHGSGGLRVQSVYLTQHLASWGYVVIAPDHPRDVLGGSSDDRPEVLRARPRQISRSIDAVLVELDGMIDRERIGVAGHSFGAFTALALAGGKLDLVALRDACTSDPDQLVCSGVDDELVQGVVDGFADPRITVAIALAPAGRIAFGPSGLAAIAIPVQIQGGTADTLATPTAEVIPIFDGLAATRSLALIDRAAHFSFTDICILYELSGGAGGPLDFLTTEGCGDTTLPIDRVHGASRTLATVFFDVHLRGVTDDHAYLLGVPDASVR